MPKIPENQKMLHVSLALGKIYLGSPEVVEGLVRDLMKKATDARGAVLQGETADLRPALDAAARRFQEIFYGRDPAYLATGWQRVQFLGQALVDGGGLGGEAEDAVYRLAVGLIARTLEVSTQFEDDQLTEAQMQDAVDKLVETYTCTLLGVSVPRD